MSPKTHEDRPVRTMDDLLGVFYDAEKPRPQWRVGTEAEKFGIFRDGGGPIPYEGSGGVRVILAALAERHGWFEHAEYDGGAVISLLRGESSITLEPGGQLELSGAPQETIHGTCAEFRGHMAELRDISDELGIAWLGLGFHPFASQSELPWVPKLRYGIMREYLPTRGSMALDMMRRTCTVQANVDYADERDAMRKLVVGLKLQPIVTAMFANSPWVERKQTGGRSHRMVVWQNTDPDRSGLLPFLWAKDSASYVRYVEWALDVPMFLVKRGNQVLRNTGQTFRAFMKDGFEGEKPLRSDWETHLNTLFPEVRIKKTIEVRGADGQDTRLTCALPALWKGIYYHEPTLDRALALTESLRPDDVQAAIPMIAERALNAKLQGRRVGDRASEVLELATDGLASLSNLNRHGEDETIHLARLKELVDSGRSPADALLEKIQPGPNFLEQVIEHAEIDSRTHKA